MKSDHPAIRAAHVLVVEDEPLCRRSLERTLTRMGCTVSLAPGAPEALEIAATGGVDVVLTDLKLPGIDGLELIRRVAELDPATPCIAMTAHGGSQRSIEALRAGAFWYLEKPLDESPFRLGVLDLRGGPATPIIEAEAGCLRGTQGDARGSMRS